MTQSIYLVSMSFSQNGKTPINDVVDVLINSDSSANAKINAALACNAFFTTTVNSQGTNYTPGMETDYTSTTDAFYPTYFDTVIPASSSGGVPGSGILSANGDAVIMLPRSLPGQQLGTGYSPVS